MNNNEERKLNTGRKVRIIYFSIFIALAAAVLFSFIISTITIYKVGVHATEVGDSIYSPSIVKDAFLKILWIVILFILSIIGAFFINHYFPINPKNLLKLSKSDILNMTKVPHEALEGKEDSFKENMNLYNALIKKERIYLGVTLVTSSLCFIMIVIYLTNTKNFPGTNAEHITEEVLTMIFYLLPWVCITIIAWGIYLLFKEKHSKQKLQLVVALRTNGKKVYKQVISKPLLITRQVIRTVIIVTAIVFIFVGAFSDGFKQTLIKAINICTECIGLG